MSHKRTYGWKPQLADHRDFPCKLVAPASLPPRVDRIGLGTPIEDQGQTGSCTGNSTAAAAEIVSGQVPLSRLMIYYNGRAFEGSTRQDEGCQIRDVIKGLQKYGVCSETIWPFNVNAVTTKPVPAAYQSGTQFKPKIAEYNSLQTLQDIKVALSQGLPVIFGFSVPEYFEDADVASTGWVPFPTASDKIIGGHAVMACGYIDNPEQTGDDSASAPFVWVRNSWGADWGIQGYFKMDQKWFTDSSNVTDDYWVLIPATKPQGGA